MCFCCSLQCLLYSEEQKNQIEQDMAPFGFMDDGLGDASFTDDDGDRWFKADEYGDKSYMWEYLS